MSSIINETDFNTTTCGKKNTTTCGKKNTTTCGNSILKSAGKFISTVNDMPKTLHNVDEKTHQESLKKAATKVAKEQLSPENDDSESEDSGPEEWEEFADDSDIEFDDDFETEVKKRQQYDEDSDEDSDEDEELKTDFSKKELNNWMDKKGALLSKIDPNITKKDWFNSSNIAKKNLSTFLKKEGYNYEALLDHIQKCYHKKTRFCHPDKKDRNLILYKKKLEQAHANLENCQREKCYQGNREHLKKIKNLQVEIEYLKECIAKLDEETTIDEFREFCEVYESLKKDFNEDGKSICILEHKQVKKRQEELQEIAKARKEEVNEKVKALRKLANTLVFKHEDGKSSIKVHQVEDFRKKIDLKTQPKRFYWALRKSPQELEDNNNTANQTSYQTTRFGVKKVITKYGALKEIGGKKCRDRSSKTEKTEKQENNYDKKAYEEWTKNMGSAAVSNFVTDRKNASSETDEARSFTETKFVYKPTGLKNYVFQSLGFWFDTTGKPVKQFEDGLVEAIQYLQNSETQKSWRGVAGAFGGCHPVIMELFLREVEIRFGNRIEETKNCKAIKQEAKGQVTSLQARQEMHVLHLENNLKEVDALKLNDKCVKQICDFRQELALADKKEKEKERQELQKQKEEEIKIKSLCTTDIKLTSEQVQYIEESEDLRRQLAEIESDSDCDTDCDTDCDSDSDSDLDEDSNNPFAVISDGRNCRDITSNESSSSDEEEYTVQSKKEKAKKKKEEKSAKKNEAKEKKNAKELWGLDQPSKHSLGRQECLFFKKNRACRFGKNCKNLHNGHEPQEGDNICPYGHHCKFKDTCRLRHVREECNHYKKHGVCKHGKDCIHLHNGRNPKEGDDECPFGKCCKYQGKTCLLKHNTPGKFAKPERKKSPLRSTNNLRVDRSFVNLPKKEECRHYANNGCCMFGVKCHHLHNGHPPKKGDKVKKFSIQKPCRYGNKCTRKGCHFKH